MAMDGLIAHIPQLAPLSPDSLDYCPGPDFSGSVLVRVLDFFVVIGLEGFPLCRQSPIKDLAPPDLILVVDEFRIKSGVIFC